MRHWKTWVGLVISAVIVYLAFRKIDLRQLLENLQKADYLYLIPIVTVIFLSVALRAVRWDYLLRPIKKIGFHRLFEGIVISFMANNVLPVRMGEFVRAYIIGRSERISASASFATVVVERLFDGLIVLGLLALILTFFQLPPGNIPFKKGLLMGGYITMAICGFSFVILLIIKNKTDWFFKTALFLSRPFSAKLANRGISSVQSFKQGLLSLGSARIMVIVFLYSLVTWAVFSYSIYLMGLAFGLKLSLAATTTVLLAVCLALMIPSTPGYIGPYHAAVAYSLVLYHIPLEKALSLSIVFHAVNYIPITLLGFLYLGKHHLSLKKIREAEEKAVGK
jgi:glycosyltransferase 2 family protein